MDDPRAPGGRSPARPPPWSTIAAIAPVRNIRLCFLVGVFTVAWYGTVLTFLPLWVIRQLHLSPSSISVVMSAIGAAGAVAAAAASALSDRIGRRPAMAIFALLGTLLPVGLRFAAGDLATVCAVVFAGGPFLAGFLSDAYSVRAPLWMACALALAAAVTSLFLHETAPRTRKHTVAPEDGPYPSRVTAR